ncbi:uncharacterized protein BDW43DRAFT_315024 [Aspergillus alliaceus]|uniref:uncharacterized protein n=1 Tax=Petromyces alliaceus TaxID=209559 RepID=UPI0012A3C69B|nr:uncharacterized protein BDW43DRAFT_315024 [Aspergillus alliaceus]KAB8229446.1 hypothetical protein BDW43DRAFT_315024 [Aspergillus alliaceus]
MLAARFSTVQLGEDVDLPEFLLTVVVIAHVSGLLFFRAFEQRQHGSGIMPVQALTILVAIDVDTARHVQLHEGGADKLVGAPGQPKKEAVSLRINLALCPIIKADDEWMVRLTLLLPATPAERWLCVARG